MLALSQTVSAACIFFANVLLARALGPSGFGVFAAILAVVMIVSPLAGFGVAGFLLRAFGAEGWQAMAWIQACFRFISMSTLAAIAILTVWLAAFSSSASHQELLPYFVPHLVATMAIELLIARLQLEERFLMVSIAQMLPAVSRLALLAVGLSYFNVSEGMIVAATAYSIVGSIVCVVSIKPLLSFFRGDIALVGYQASTGPSSNPRLHSIKKLMSNLWPFGTAGFLYLVLMQSPIFLTETLAGASDAGVFSAAFSLLLALYILPTVVYQRFLLPRLHRWSAHDTTTLRNVYIYGNRIMLLFGSGMGIAIFVLAPWLVNLFFGPEFRPSAPVLQILALCAPLRFLSSSVGAVLVTRDNMKRKVFLLGLSASVSVVASILLIPHWSAFGTAIAVVISETVLLVSMLCAAKKFVLAQN